MSDLSITTIEQHSVVQNAIHVLTCMDAGVRERIEIARDLAEQFGLPWPPYDAEGEEVDSPPMHA
jgi:hypothetical protein